ncbi:hypothetical protein HDA40_008039 [Hamadaea flava]|uniref:Uncharacterized protein n=1 Tax=Hamadaea flava TaxID=1742688 RepID=A0ABV8LWZ2_9ACTN|nr:hypothetical protein [Hamadaea flava]MCP2329532.1 hypothetical protein [Hamadaea flava]
MHAARRTLVGAVLTVLAVLGSLLVVPSPAQAYGTLTVKFAVVDTGNCARVRGNLPVTKVTGGCMLYDSFDDTYFKTDPGGVAVKIEMYDSSGMVAKVEFHPDDELLWIYDTRNDGDTVYVYVDSYWNNWIYGPFHAEGTDNVLDYEVVDLSFDEGTSLGIGVKDSENIYDPIFSESAVA